MSAPGTPAPVLSDEQLDVVVDQLASRVAGPLVDALAPRIADALAPELARAMRELPDAHPTEWVDAAEIARRFDLSVDTVYAHADEFGARRLGDGPKARLRFNPERVEQALIARSTSERSNGAEPPPPAARAAPARRTGRARADRVPLLPIRGARE